LKASLRLVAAAEIEFLFFAFFDHTRPLPATLGFLVSAQRVQRGSLAGECTSVERIVKQNM
jgi:hypothetical protein